MNINNESQEVWKEISNNMYYYTALLNKDYEVSNFGRIRNKKTGKIISTYKKGNKLRWTMHKRLNGYDTTLQFLVDHTVYEAFIGPCYGSHIKHKDGDLMNNCVWNLEVK